MRRVGVDQKMVFVRRRSGTGIGQDGACMDVWLETEWRPANGTCLKSSILARAFGPQVTSTHSAAPCAAPIACPQRPSTCDFPTGSPRSPEEHTYDLQSLMRPPYDIFCLKKKQTNP